MEIQPHHLNLKHVQNLQYRIHVFYFSTCCTKSKYTCWDKVVKHASPSAKGFLRHIHWNFTESKRVSFLHTTQREDRIFVQLFLMIFYIVQWRTCHNHIDK